MRIKKNIFMFIVFIITAFVFIGNVDARTEKIVTGSSQPDVSGWSWKMTQKGIDSSSNRNAWCTTFGHPSGQGFVNGTYRSSYCTSWFSKAAPVDYIIAEQIVDIIKKNVSNVNDRYAYTVMTLNTFFYSKGITGAVKFTTSTNSGSNPYCYRPGQKKYECGYVSDSLKKKINNWIGDAEKAGGKIYQSLKGPTKPKFNDVKSQTLVKKKNGNKVYYLSYAFKVEGDDKLPNGEDVEVKVTVPQVPGVKSRLCKGDACNTCSGDNCSTSMTGYGSYKLRVEAENGANIEGLKIPVKAYVGAKFSYHKGVVLCHTKEKTNQAMTVLDKVTVQKDDDDSINFKVPKSPGETPGPEEKEIEIMKVDENGNAMPGATIELYDSSNNKLNLTKSSDGTSFTYTTTADIAAGTKFKIVESRPVPDGYKLGSPRIIPVTFGGNSTKCYRATDDWSDPVNAVPMQYCDRVRMCQNGTEAPVEVKDGDYTCSNYIVPSSGADTGSDTGNTGSDTGDDTGSDTGDDTGSNTGDDTGDSGSGSDSGQEPAPQQHYNPVCTVNGSVVDDMYCDDNEYTPVTVNGNSIFLEFENVLNDVTISKKDVTGKEEVPGANLKICTETEYNKSKNNCTVYESPKSGKLEWTSTNEPKTFTGLKPGKYYIIETLPPDGYVLATTATEFSIDDEGNVKVGTTTMPKNTVVINNAMNKGSISKTDIATTKELPGAHLSICLAGLKKDIGKDTCSEQKNVTITNEESDDTETTETTETTDTTETTETTETTDTTSSNDSDDVDEKNEESTNVDDYGIVWGSDCECLTPAMGDGSDSSWVSTDKPHEFSGLPAGTYFLVETTAPYGYATAEAILFKMNYKGELTDIKGNKLSDNKIVMHDKPIKQVKTGSTALIVAVIGAILAAAASVYFFAFHNAAHAGAGAQLIKKVKTRKIHKK